MEWPSFADYCSAIQSPDNRFDDEELRHGRAKENSLGMPVFVSGEFSSVFCVDCAETGRSWALKCYTRDYPGLRDRYTMLADHFGADWPGYLVHCKWLDQGIRVKGQWYSCVRMPWLQGVSIGQFVHRNADQPKVLERLAEMWWKLAASMRSAQIAHPDLHPDNILLVANPNTKRLHVKLIDLDSLYIPAQAKSIPPECGHSAFQHPRLEIARDYGADVDRFSILVIYANLICLACGGRALWQEFGDEERLLFRPRDLVSPELSPALRSLWGLTDPRAQDAIGRLILAAHGPPSDTPHLNDAAPNGALASLTFLERRVINRALAESQWPGEYEADISADSPTCFIILVQQSVIGQTTRDKSGSSAKTFVEMANGLIRDLAVRCNTGSGIRECFHVAVVRYGSQVSQGLRGSTTGDGLVGIREIAENPLRIEKRLQPYVDETTGEVIQHSASMPVWVEVNESITDESPLCAAINEARKTVATFLEKNPNCYPPLVLNLGDGRSTDGDPSTEAAALRNMMSNDGAVLFYNACFTDDAREGVVFPVNDDQLPDDDTRRMFGISSQLCSQHQDAASNRGMTVHPSARGFSLNKEMDCIVQFYQLGTRAAFPKRAVAPRPMIFISAKSEDYPHARVYYKFLSARGLNVFLSCESLPELGTSDYREAIDKALDEAKHMIVVTSSAKHVESSWVKAEWGLFINEKRSNRKAGNLITITIGSVQIGSLPASLRYYEVITGGPESFEKVLRYVSQ